jgi:hypothetical protein
VKKANQCFAELVLGLNTADPLSTQHLEGMRTILHDVVRSLENRKPFSSDSQKLAKHVD